MSYDIIFNSFICGRPHTIYFFKSPVDRIPGILYNMTAKYCIYVGIYSLYLRPTENSLGRLSNPENNLKFSIFSISNICLMFIFCWMFSMYFL